MQRKEACSVPLLAGEPCQPSPLNSYILNYVILRNKVQSQFIKSMHPRGGGVGSYQQLKNSNGPYTAHCQDVTENKTLIQRQIIIN